jgi:hypothetical protein
VHQWLSRLRPVYGQLRSGAAAEVEDGWPWMGQPLVDPLVLIGHHCPEKRRSASSRHLARSISEMRPTAATRASSGIANEAGHAIPDHFGDASGAQHQDWRPTCKRLDHNQPKGLGPPNGEHQRRGVAEKLVLIMPAYLADEVHIGPQQGQDRVLPVLPVCTNVWVISKGLRHTRGYFQRHSSSACDTYGRIQAFFGRRATEEREVAPGPLVQRELCEIDTVINRSREIRPLHRCPLGVTDRDDWGVDVFTKGDLELG